MKTTYTYRFLLFVLLGACMACEKSDSDKDWGNSMIYMPQATLFDGGNTIHYPVPFDKTAALQNYIVDEDENTIKVIMGVYRSGLEELQGYSVSVLPNPARLQQGLAEVEDSFELPADLYSIPTTIDVPDGERGANFYLTIDREKLMEEYGHLWGKSMIVALSLREPTRYTLNEDLSTVVVIINMTDFVPEPELPNILEGGEFNSGDETHWTIVKQDPMVHDANISLNEKLSLSTPSGSFQTNYAFYHAIEVVEGKRYQLRGDIETSDVSNGWLEFYVHPDEPVNGGDYNVGKLIGFDSWTPGCLGTIMGKIEDLYCDGPGASPGAIFTADFTGSAYFVIKAGVWDGSIGKIEIDNLKILELED